MSSPATYAVDFVEQRSRLTTFFRYLLVIPHLVVLLFLGIGAWFAVIGAWFAIVFTGRYPAGLYAFVAGVLQYVARVNGYVALATDAYPSFAPGDRADYPVRLRIAPPLPEYSRVKTFFRLILMIPVYLIAYVLMTVGMIATMVSWFWIVITGRQQRGLQAAIVLAQSYTMRAYTYYALLTEDWPSFSDEVSPTPDRSALTPVEHPAGLPGLSEAPPVHRTDTTP